MENTYVEKIALADKFFGLVNLGIKTTTIRARHRDYKIGYGQFYSDVSDLTANIIIKDIEYKTFGDITDNDALSDGFNSAEELRNELLVFYPTLRNEDEITKVWFTTV